MSTPLSRLSSRMNPALRQSINLTGVNGLFWFAWAFGCYQTVYLKGIGFSASQLGILNAIACCVNIISVTLWGVVSDKMGSLKKVLIITLSGGALLYSLVPLVPTDLPYSPVLLICLLPIANIFRGSQGPFTENLLVRNCNETGLNYGVLRSLGSLLFTVGSLIISAILPKIGVENTFWICGLLMIPPILFAFFSRDPGARSGGRSGRRQLNLGELFRVKPYVLFLVFCFLFYIAANCEGSFIPFFMENVGISSQQYGVFLAYRALLEIPFLLLMVKLRRRFPLRILLLAATALMAVESLGLGLVVNSLPTMLLFCTFFGLGNGLFIGSSLNYVYELAPDHLKASAQAFFTSVASVSGILGNLLGGMVFDAIGAKPFYLVVSLVFFLSILVFFLSFAERKKRPVTA